MGFTSFSPSYRLDAGLGAKLSGNASWGMGLVLHFTLAVSQLLVNVLNVNCASTVNESVEKQEEQDGRWRHLKDKRGRDHAVDTHYASHHPDVLFLHFGGNSKRLSIPLRSDT
jgi:hypothetical protein